MRLFIVGLIQLFLVSAVMAGVTGKVESIGFNSLIRADCWIPMVVQVSSDSTGPENYILQVVQSDRDGDEVVYTRPIVANPGNQTYWTYFKPESINGGVPVLGMGTVSDLPKRLRIFLADPKNGRRITQINNDRKLPSALERGEYRTFLLNNRTVTAGQKLALVVGREPQLKEFDPKMARVLGMMEIFLHARVDGRQLPDNVIGYEAVDAVIWTSATPVDGAQLRALRQYVQGGGRLVVLQNSEKDRMSRLDEFLPVTVDRIEEWTSLDPLKSILQPTESDPPRDERTGRVIDSFANSKGPFRMARAQPLPNAVVVRNVTWPDKTTSPFIARRLFGMGTVTWVAQDLSDPTVTGIDFGWPRVWEEIFGWRDFGMAFPMAASTNSSRDLMFQRYTSPAARDMGLTYIANGMDPQSKTAALLSVAFIFFVGYWIIAGPGSFLVLASRRRTQWSWFTYAVIAVLAVVLTAGVTKIMLTGSAEVRHISMVRMRTDTNQPARVLSRFGIYLPEDRTASPAPVTLTKRDTSAAAWITPFTIDPDLIRGDVALRDTKYEVPIQSEDAGETVEVGIPFRSTLKKLQADWTGDAGGRISGKPVLVADERRILGKLVNNTGRDLRDVLMVFRDPLGSENPRLQDQVIYLRVWGKGSTIELSDLWTKGKPTLQEALSLSLAGHDVKRGSWASAQKWIFDDLRTNGLANSNFDDSDKEYRRSFPIISLFDSMTPMTNATQNYDRVEILRRGVRGWEVSGPLGAGAMVILAQTTNDDIPLPMEVDGEKPQASGRTFYQFIMPLDLSQVSGPTTQPSK